MELTRRCTQIAKILQETEGIKMSDFELTKVKTLRDLSLLLVHGKPEQKKLAQSLQEQEGIMGLANVKVYQRRVTPVDKEKALGRWKIIEKELFDRGLPATTSKRYRSNRKSQVEL